MVDDAGMCQRFIFGIKMMMMMMMMISKLGSPYQLLTIH